MSKLFITYRHLTYLIARMLEPSKMVLINPQIRYNLSVSEYEWMLSSSFLRNRYDVLERVRESQSIISSVTGSCYKEFPNLYASIGASYHIVKEKKKRKKVSTMICCRFLLNHSPIVQYTVVTLFKDIRFKGILLIT